MLESEKNEDKHRENTFTISKLKFSQFLQQEENSKKVRRVTHLRDRRAVQQSVQNKLWRRQENARDRE
jgi:hypothetical protein